MMTFENITYGPVRSRRLGLSLGINLMPKENKVCTFECIYCECGFTKKGVVGHVPSRSEVKVELEKTLSSLSEQGMQLDVITFAGNGEPTLHPDFEGVIDDTIELRDKYHSSAKISVLSNATMLHKDSVCRALNRVDNNILKLDSAFDATVKLIDAPTQKDYSVSVVMENLRKFNGDFILQTMFLRGSIDSQPVDNTTSEEVTAWSDMVRSLRPKQVMIYSIDRETPVKTLEKVSKEQLDKIAEPLRKEGFDILSV